MLLANANSPLGESTSIRMNAMYARIEQPMPIYHSTAELKKYEFTGDGKPLIFTGAKDIYLYHADRTSVEEDSNIMKFHHKVFLATGEKYVPDHVDAKGKIHYKVNDKFQMTSTDNCYVRLYYYSLQFKSIMIFTSSGIFNIDNTHFKVTAAIPYGYIYRPHGKVLSWEDKYRTRLDKLISPTKGRIANNFKLAAQLLLNPLGDAFMNPDTAVLRAFGTVIKKEDRKKVYSSEVFNRAIIKELGRLMPTIKKAVMESISPKKVASYLKQIADEAVISETTSVEDKLKAVRAILELGYADQVVQGANSSYSEPLVGLGLSEPSSNDNGQKILNEAGIELLEEESLKDKEEVSITDKEADEIEKDLGVPSGYSTED